MTNSRGSAEGAFSLDAQHAQRLRRYAQEAARFTGRLSGFYLLGLKLLGALVLTVAVLVGGATLAIVMSKSSGASSTGLALGVSVPLAIVAWIALGWLGALAAAGLQNLAWNHTESSRLRFASRVRVGALTRLKIKNLLLVVVTLGLYRPFAVVAVTRMHLEAVEARTSGDVDAWLARASSSAGTGSGEMSGDFFGIDIGL